MWRRKNKHLSSASDGPPASADALIADECAAFLSGHYADYLLARKQPVPAWAWLNALGHASRDDLQSLTKADDATGPLAVVADLATQMLALVQVHNMALASVQNRIIVPLELHLAAMNWLPCPHDAREMTQILKTVVAEGTQPFSFTAVTPSGSRTHKRQWNSFDHRGDSESDPRHGH